MVGADVTADLPALLEQLPDGPTVVYEQHGRWVEWFGLPDVDQRLL